MKKTFTLCIVALLSFTLVRAQYFVANMEVRSDTLIFKVKAVGNFTAQPYDIELFLRWDAATDVSFSPPMTDHSDFPGLAFDFDFNESLFEDPGYQNVWINHLYSCSETPPRSYTNGTVYELFRTTMAAGIPPLMQLVADNNTGTPYYFVVLSMPPLVNDLAPYDPASPFIDETGSDGSFYYKNYVFENLQRGTIANNLADINHRQPRNLSQEAIGKHVDSIRQHLRERTIQSKTTVADPGKSNVGVQVYVNPVINHNLKLTVTNAAEGPVQVQIINIAGTVIQSFRQNLNNGENHLDLKLLSGSAGIYLVKVIGEKGSLGMQKIIVQ